ncbi:MAG: SRPBCC domain-containing protein [Bacteroidales bacterium]|nr:SRPBCC domain-containing protein [Bacteroidales bacterium]
METGNFPVITVQTRVDASLEETWNRWITPEDVMAWNHASEDWVCPAATNDLRVGGKFNYRMEAADGSMGFDFEGEYDLLEPMKTIGYFLSDGRKVRIHFSRERDLTVVTESFDAEGENPLEMQRFGWQCILDNFRKHVEF